MKDVANKLVYFLGQNIKSIAIITENRIITFMPKYTDITFEDNYLLLVGKKEVRRIPYDEIKDIEG